MSSKFKEQWLAEDKRCEHCNQVIEVARGLNKQNLKRLIFAKPTIQDWMMFFIIIMVLLMAWRYNVETAVCHETLTHIDEICTEYKTTYIMPNQSFVTAPFNMSQFNNAQT